MFRSQIPNSVMTMQPRSVGYRFRPEIEFLIKLLQFKAAGGGDISGCTAYPEDLCYLNMYGPGKEPWKLFSGEHEIWELHDVTKRNIKEKYVLTDLTKIGKKNVARTAGAGTWDDQSTAKPVEYGGHEMGYWRTLTYEYWGDEAADNCYYYMNELHLSEYALSQVKVKRDDYVICRVLKNESKRCRIRHGKKRVSQEQEDCPVTKKKKKLSRYEKTQASCSKVVPEEEPVDDIWECIDFADLELQDSDVADLRGFEQPQFVSESWGDYPVMQGNCDPQVLSIHEYSDPVYVPEMFAENQPQEVASFASDQSWDYPQMQGTCNPQLLSVHEYSDPVYVPEMFAVAQNQEQRRSELWDYAEMQPNWVSSCSNSTMPDQDSLADEWSFEELMKFVNT